MVMSFSNDQRVLIWAPGRDGLLTRDFLRKGGFIAETFSSCAQYCEALAAGAAVLILADELLSHPESGQVRDLLAGQPSWSDIPVVIVARRETSGAGLRRILDDYGSVSILHRPLSLDTLCSTVGAGLRARRRQYQVRDLLNQRDETDRRRAEFLAMLAHELRNPLSPIRTGLQVLRVAESKELANRTFSMMERQVENLSRLIDDLLEVSRLTRGKIELEKGIVDIHRVLSDVLEARVRMASEKGLKMRVLADSAEPIRVEGDQTRIEQMVDNVLVNAIKFTPAGGDIALRAHREDDQAVIRVRDSGIGIAPVMLDAVFDLFTQTGPTLDRTDGGLGIGLTVVKTLAELHGGTVKAVSEGMGKGTEIVIKLPVLPHDVVYPESLRPISSGGRPRRVLLVEDNRDSADLLATYLRGKGHTVYVAYDGAAGFNAAFRERPDVIICDVGLPGMDGYELARKLTKTAELQGCKLVAVTGYGEQRDRERGHDAGFQHYIVKPADPDEIARLIVV
jgi:signal transduction histidine kinase